MFWCHLTVLIQLWPQTISVSLDVNAAPLLNLDVGNLTFDAPLNGPNASSQTLTVTNSGSGTLDWTATSGASWLTVGTATGSLGAGATGGIPVSADVTGLAAGTYTTVLSISAAGVTNSPQLVAVTLNVNVVPVIGLAPVSLDFSMPLADPTPDLEVITVTNSGTGTLGWSASSGAAWLTVSPTGGSLGAGASEPMTVTADVAVLSAGSYSTLITVSATGAANTPQVIPVTLVVNNVPTISLDVSSVAIAAVEGTTGSQNLVLENSGTGTLTWTATSSASWLTVTPAGGSLPAGTTVIVTTSADTIGLPPGTYSATITIDDPGAGNGPQTVFVSLTVTLSAVINHKSAGACGSIGLDLMIPVAMLWWVRRRKRRKA